MKASKSARFLSATFLLCLFLTVFISPGYSGNDVHALGEVILPVDKNAGAWYGLTYWGHDVYGKYQYSAIDLNMLGDADNGQNVFAVQDGVVQQTDPVIIKHTVPLVLRNGYTYSSWYTMYGHMNNITVTTGSSVNKGTVIGKVGSVGASSPHLHFVIYKDYADSIDSAISPYWLPGDYYNYALYADDPYGTREPAGLYEALIFRDMPGTSGITLTNGAVTNLSNTDATISASLSPLSYVTTCGAYIGTSPSALSKITETANGNVNQIWYNLAADWKPLSPGTLYYYRIYAVVNGVEYQSALSSFTTTGLAKPTFATISVSKNSVLVGENVTFTFTSNNSASYTIGIDKESTRIDTSVCDSGYTRSFSEPGSYSAYVTAWNSSGFVDSTRVYFTVVAPTVPLAPTGLKAVSTGYNSAKVTWNAVSGASGYEVWRKVWSTGTFALLATPTSTTLSNYGLSTNTTYYYKVRAYSLNGSTKTYSKDSAVVAVTPIPSTPMNFKATSTSHNSIKLTWAAVSGASGYVIFRSSTSTGSYSYLTMIANGSTLSYTNPYLACGTTYYYKIRAYRIVGTTKVYSNYSVVASAKPVPAVPGSFAVARYSSTSIKASWAAVSGASGYEVFRSTSLSGTYTLIKTTTAISYINTRLTTGRTYYFKVRAYRLVGATKIHGAFTAVKSAIP